MIGPITERDSEDLQPRRLDFRSLLQDLAIALVPTLIIGAVVYATLEDTIEGIIYFVGASLIYPLVFGGVVAYRARQHFGEETAGQQ